VSCCVVLCRAVVHLQDLVAQNKAYRNRIRAMPSSAFAFENRPEPPSARYDPAIALLK
jgi:hypothetical protein